MAKSWKDLARKEKIDELYMAVNGLVATNRAQAVRLARALERIVSLEKAALTAIAAVAETGPTTDNRSAEQRT